MGMFNKNCLLSDNPAPNPREFKILWNQSFQIGQFVILTIKYPNCINFEGMKILLYFGYEIEWFKDIEEIDPHFRRSNPTPIARFAPTSQGMFLAKKLCNFMMKGQEKE
jgi:hypothetical protein